MKITCHCLFHIIIVSASDKKFLTRVNQDILYNYIQAMLYNKQCTPLAVNGNSNHVHIAVDVAPDLPIQRLVKEIQVNTTDFLRRDKSVFPEFVGWNLNYIALSYHKSQLDELKSHISDQFNYHQKISFEEELTSIIGETENARV